MTPAEAIDECERLTMAYIEACEDEGHAYVRYIARPEHLPGGRAYRRAMGRKIAADAVLIRACEALPAMGVIGVAIPLYIAATTRAAAAFHRASVETSNQIADQEAA